MAYDLVTGQRTFYNGSLTDAVGIAEGWIEADTEQEVVEAWQYLIDTGLCWSLQGWFGRTAQSLIDDGVCTRTTNEKES